MIKKISALFKPLLTFAHRIIRLPKYLTLKDYFVIIVCLLVVGWGLYQVLFHINQNVPRYGGVLTEGIIAQSSADVEKTLERLTMTSLVRYDEQGQIQPYLAKSWAASEDRKKYTFTLQDSVESQSLVDQYNNAIDRLQGVTLSTKDAHTLEAQLDRPFGLLVENFTKPYFTGGPYLVKKRTERDVELMANHQFVLGRPYIDKVIIAIYQNIDQLDRAIKRHDVTNAVTQRSVDTSFQNLSLQLPRFVYVFYNLKKPPFQDKSIRQKLTNNQSLDQPIAVNLLVGEDDYQKNLANELVKRWGPLKVTLTVEKIKKKDFQDRVLNKKDYQALIYGVDLGRDRDEYLFWHSSQIANNGQNIAQFGHERADKLLEDYRLSADPGVRAQKYEELKKILAEEIPAQQLGQVSLTYSVSKKIKGVKVNQGVTPADRFQNVWEWYIKTK